MKSTICLRFLGTVQAECDGERIHDFRSRKALALLGYLAVQGQPVPRECLTNLFWEDQPQDRARANLSWVLNRISARLLGCLQADRHTVQFRCPANYWVDTDAFAELTKQGDPTSLAAAVQLYRGGFLEGLYLETCSEFEIWLVGERERWRQRATSAFEALVQYHSRCAEYAKALRFARRLLELEPWHEEMHRQAMRLLAWDGQRGAALAQYETCCRALAAELGVEPTIETMASASRSVQASYSFHRNPALSMGMLPPLPSSTNKRRREPKRLSLSLGNRNWHACSGFSTPPWRGRASSSLSPAGRVGARRPCCTSSPGAPWIDTPICYWRRAIAAPTRVWAIPICPFATFWPCSPATWRPSGMQGPSPGTTPAGCGRWRQAWFRSW